MSDASDSDDDFFDARTDLASPRLSLDRNVKFGSTESDELCEKLTGTNVSDGGPCNSSLLELQDVLGKGDDYKNGGAVVNIDSEIVPLQQDRTEASQHTDDEKPSNDTADVSNTIDCDETSSLKTALVDKDPVQEDVHSIVEDESPAAQPLSPPDIVASSIKERPKDLPGVKAVKIEPTSSSRSSINRPPRPPPPRPKQPPQRPPMLSRTRNMKSSLDEGLQTPNSTVDNLITKEFAAAVLQDRSANEEKKPEKKPESTSLPDEMSKAPVSSNLHVPDANETAADSPPQPSSNASSLKRSSTKASTPNRLMDEEKPWSEMTKNTLLRIDSTPGLEILSTVIVRNLDTGQTMPLSEAAEQVSQYLNPLALQIMSRTKEFNCPQQAGPGGEAVAPNNVTPPIPHKRASIIHNQSSITQSDEDTMSTASDEIIKIGGEAPTSSHIGNTKTNMKIWKKRIGKSAKRVKAVTSTQVGRAIEKVKSAKLGEAASGENSLHVSSDEEPSEFSSTYKIKQSSSHKGPYHFSKLKLVQDIAVHVGAVWSMKFSHCGRLLATAGQNNIIWVWVLKEYYSFFNDLRNKYDSKDRGAVFATPPRSSADFTDRRKFDERTTTDNSQDDLDDEEDAPFRSLPFSSYVGHTADVLDLAWSKNYFTLSSSMDKTVRLWHVSQKECLCCFQHIDFVTAIAFHPKDDRYFLSGSLDGKLRLWNIPDKKVALWNEVTPDSSSSQISNSGISLITSVNFCENGKFAVCGTYDGRCLFYDTEHLKYHTQIHVRSSRRRNNKGHKITGIEALHGEHKILVTSNDSRVRLYDLRDLSLSCKYKGLTNTSSQIKASFSHDCKYIICGSEDKSIYIWRTQIPQDAAKISSLRRDRNELWESVRAHDAVVTCAIFAPFPHLVIREEEKGISESRVSLNSKKSTSHEERCVIISADFSGVIKVFMNG